MSAFKSEHTRALDAGMTHKQAARWLAYLRMKAAKGEKPIELHEAVRQLEEAHLEHACNLAVMALREAIAAGAVDPHMACPDAGCSPECPARLSTTEGTATP